MPSVLVCALAPLEDELAATVIGRAEVFAHLQAASVAEALDLVAQDEPALVLVERELPQAIELVERLASGTSPIVVVSHGPAGFAAAPLLAAGAHAVVETPAGPHWDEVIGRLLAIPARIATRIPLQVQFEGESAAIETIRGTVVDLSVSGILAESEAPLAVGAILDVSLQLEAGALEVTGCAQVVRVDSVGRFGIRFFGLEGDGAERIRGFVEGDEVVDEGG